MKIKILSIAAILFIAVSFTTQSCTKEVVNNHYYKDTALIIRDTVIKKDTVIKRDTLKVPLPKTYSIVGLWSGRYFDDKGVVNSYSFNLSLTEDSTLNLYSLTIAGGPHFITGNWNLKDSSFTATWKCVYAPNYPNNVGVVQKVKANFSPSKGTLSGVFQNQYPVSGYGTFELKKVE